MAEKRRASVEGNTPGKPPEKKDHREASSRKTLFGESESKPKSVRAPAWTDAEDSALVQYICLFTPNAETNKWPYSKQAKFWDDCALAVNQACKVNRTGNNISNL